MPISLSFHSHDQWCFLGGAICSCPGASECPTPRLHLLGHRRSTRAPLGSLQSTGWGGGRRGKTLRWQEGCPPGYVSSAEFRGRKGGKFCLPISAKCRQNLAVSGLGGERRCCCEFPGKAFIAGQQWSPKSSMLLLSWQWTSPPSPGLEHREAVSLPPH